MMSASRYWRMNPLCFVVVVQAMILLLCASCAGELYQLGKNQRELVGKYHQTSFVSQARDTVNLSVYLPPKWKKNRKQKYPLLILLHGQGGDEKSMPKTIRAGAVTKWIEGELLPEMVIVALNSGKNTQTAEWFSEKNTRMLTSISPNELRAYMNEYYNTSVNENQISIIGKSRGATGALFLAFQYPDAFASSISMSFVGDYALDKLREAVDQNLDMLQDGEVKIKILIGAKDHFDLKYGRRGSYIISEFLNYNKVEHSLEILENVAHSSYEITKGNKLYYYLKFSTDSWN